MEGVQQKSFREYVPSGNDEWRLIMDKLQKLQANSSWLSNSSAEQVEQSKEIFEDMSENHDFWFEKALRVKVPGTESIPQSHIISPIRVRVAARRLLPQRSFIGP